jgi:hypothetical protein
MIRVDPSSVLATFFGSIRARRPMLSSQRGLSIFQASPRTRWQSGKQVALGSTSTESHGGEPISVTHERKPCCVSDEPGNVLVT